MRRNRTAPKIVLAVVLAALVAAAAVLGVGLARYDTVVDSDAAVGEARWSVSDEAVETAVLSIRPDYADYEGNQRTSEWSGCVATLTNDGDVDAYVSVAEGETSAVPKTDDCGSADHYRYSDEEIAMHFDVSGLSYSATSSSDGNPKSLEDVKIGVGEKIYVYATIVWITDLARDMGNENQPYDGTFGDEFDTWAGTHLTGITLKVSMRYEQAS